eukprot:4957923-Prymnesium_polylepis.1
MDAATRQGRHDGPPPPRASEPSCHAAAAEPFVPAPGRRATARCPYDPSGRLECRSAGRGDARLGDLRSQEGTRVSPWCGRAGWLPGRPQSWRTEQDLENTCTVAALRVLY